MIKAILFDVDGVLMNLPRYFASILEEQGYINAVSILHEYHKSDVDILCNTGKMKIELAIRPYLEKIGWDSPVARYFEKQYAFEKSFLNRDSIAMIQQLRNNQLVCCIATDQNHHRAEFLMEELDFSKNFDHHFISYRMGYRKVETEYWQILLKSLKSLYPEIKPDEILYFDDRQENIKAAGQFGISGRLVTDVRNFRCELAGLTVTGSLTQKTDYPESLKAHLS